MAEKGTMLMSQGNYGDSLVVYDKCLAIQLQVRPRPPPETPRASTVRARSECAQRVCAGWLR